MPLTLRNNNFLILATCVDKHDEHINEVPLISIMALRKHWTKKRTKLYVCKAWY
jgi:hypothetical protein